MVRLAVGLLLVVYIWNQGTCWAFDGKFWEVSVLYCLQQEMEK